MMPMLHASDASTFPVLAYWPPSTSDRTASIAIETGWFLANAWSQPGIEPTGTNADDAKTSGARMGNDAACAVSALLTDRPTIAKIHDRENPKQQHHGHTGDQAERAGLHPKADEVPDGQHQHDDEHVADEVGERASGEHRRTGHRQRPEPLDEALVEVLGEPDTGLDRPERDRLHEDARHQVVDVGDPPGTWIAPPNT